MKIIKLMKSLMPRTDYVNYGEMLFLFLKNELITNLQNETTLVYFIDINTTNFISISYHSTITHEKQVKMIKY